MRFRKHRDDGRDHAPAEFIAARDATEAAETLCRSPATPRRIEPALRKRGQRVTVVAPSQ
jgi:hypothetical protein